MFTKLMRIGRDAELRHTQSGDAVASLSLAYNYGRKSQDGNRPTQWVDGSLWGKQAETLVQYLTKGKLVSVTLDDVHIETFQGRNGEGHKLAARVVALELAGGRDAPDQAPDPQRQAPAAAQASKPSSGFDNMDDDIPF